MHVLQTDLKQSRSRYDFEVNKTRLADILRAIAPYKEKNQKINLEWVIEGKDRCEAILQNCKHLSGEELNKLKEQIMVSLQFLTSCDIEF